MRTVYLFLALFSIFATAVGCQDTTDYKLAPVSGTVMLDGQPLTDVYVSFQPSSTGNAVTVGPGSTAVTDSQGKYTLQTIKDEPGAVVAKHKVRIYSVHSQEAPTTEEDTGPPPKERVPEKYNYQSTLTFDVTVDGTDQADFKLMTSK